MHKHQICNKKNKKKIKKIFFSSFFKNTLLYVYYLCSIYIIKWMVRNYMNIYDGKYNFYK